MSDSDKRIGVYVQVTVHQVVDALPPFRRVEINGAQVGKAHSLRELAAFCHHAGLDDLDPEEPGAVRWIGGGPHEWDVT